MKIKEETLILDIKIAELLSQKFHCSQIMMQMGMDALKLEVMISEFLAWFEETYGSADCGDILQGDKNNIPGTCPQLICSACRRALELLESRGFPVNALID